MNENLVNNLREITEETDLSTILKSTLGGYTKKSVKDYLAYVRRQQNDMKSAFSEEMQHMQAERDALQAELEETRGEKEKNAGAVLQLTTLQNRYMELEKDMSDAVEKIAQDEEVLESYRMKNEEMQEKLQTALKEIDEWKVRCKKVQEEQVKEQDNAEEMSAERDEETSELNAHELYIKNVFLEDTLISREQELMHLKQRLDTSLRQEQNFYHALEESRTELQERRDQAEWMESENNEISRRLSEQMDLNITLTRENARLKAVNNTQKRKIDIMQKQIGENAAPEGVPEGEGDAYEDEGITLQ